MQVLPVLLLVASALVVQALPPRIVGGRDAPAGKYPFIVSLRDNGRHFCGGSVIDNRHILTAAHCLLRETGGLITVHVGTNLLNESGTVHQVERSLAHPGFEFWNQADDIGLIRVRENIVFNKKVSPILIGSANNSREGQTCQLAGWGATEVDSTASNVLQEVDLVVISEYKCRGFHWRVTDTHICTFTKYGEGACHGDSGGPLVANGQQIGLVSFGDPCAVGSPDVYTRLSSYRKWIEQAKTKLQSFD